MKIITRSFFETANDGEQSIDDISVMMDQKISSSFDDVFERVMSSFEARFTHNNVDNTEPLVVQSVKADDDSKSLLSDDNAEHTEWVSSEEVVNHENTVCVQECENENTVCESVSNNIPVIEEVVIPNEVSQSIEPEDLPVKDIKTMTFRELQANARMLGISAKGTKSDLLARISEKM